MTRRSRPERDPDLYAGFPGGFFDRQDEGDDTVFYGSPRLVHHIDDGAIAAVGDLYEELGLVDGRVLDLMGSWVSHFRRAPRHLTVLGINGPELDANTQATERVLQDLNADPRLPFDDGSFDAVTCVVSVDYLTRPIEVCAEVARVLAPRGLFVVTYSNRCFPTKAIRGWLRMSDADHGVLVAEYLRRSGGFADASVEQRRKQRAGDPLWAVVARSLTADA